MVPNNHYSPIQNGIATSRTDVVYREFSPGISLDRFVVCVWELRSTKKLSDDFIYHVMPDACIDIVFDVGGDELPLIMTPHTKMESIHLGAQFHYIGVRFYPGALGLSVDHDTVVGVQREIREISGVSLKIYAEKLRQKSIIEGREIIDALLNKMLESGCFVDDAMSARVVALLSGGATLVEVSESVGVSLRHLRRIIHERTGFSPSQLRRVLRFQAVLSHGDPTLRFADQSHLIKEFGRITGMSYGRFVQLFSDKTR